MKHFLDIPDLPIRAFVRHGKNILPQGKGDAPPAPDYKGAAQETAEGNLEAARYATQANRANQYTPWGSLEWSNDKKFDQAGYDQAMANYQQSLANGAVTPGQDAAGRQASAMNGVHGRITNPEGINNGNAWASDRQNTGGYQQRSIANMPNREDFYSGGDNWSQQMKLSPEMQALFDQDNKLQQGLFGAQNNALGRVNESMGQQFGVGDLSPGGSVYDPNLATNNATELLMQRLNPELDRQNEALRAQLANQGITQGSAAYNNAMGTFGQQRNDAQTQAALQGIGLGMQQQGMMFDQSESARQRSLAEQAYFRNLPLNELNALRTGNQVSQPQFPGYSQQATTGGPDMLGAAQGNYQAALGAANASNAQGAGMTSGIVGIASAAAMAF